MTRFRTFADDGARLRAIVVGAGPMGQGWLRVLDASDQVDTVGLVDLDLDAAGAAAAAQGRPDLPVATSITDLLRTVDADIVVNVTVPVAHHAVSTEALLVGMPVLSEKPITPEVHQGLSLAATAEHAGELLMVSQSRRYYRSIAQFRDVVRGLGRLGTVSAEFFTDPHFGGFRDQMAHPLLIDMAIHHFDAFRYVVGDEPVSVYCDEFNPAWSWYEGDAAVVASFITAAGARFVYTGSWCSPGLTTSWNGRWRVSGERGTAEWDGEGAPIWETQPELVAPDPGPVPEEFAGSLAEFIRSLRSGVLPEGHALSNIRSLAMVEAAIESAATGTRVSIPEVVSRALAHAIEAETRPRTADVLRRWQQEGLGVGSR